MGRLLLLGAAAAIALLWLFVALTTAPAAKGPGVRHELRYGRLLRLFALATALAIPALMAFVVWHHGPRLYSTGGAFIALGLLAGLLLLETEKVRIVLTDSGIVASSPWRGRREIRWDDVQSVDYARLNRWLIITGRDGATVRASRSLVGMPWLLGELEQHAAARCSPAVLRLFARKAGAATSSSPSRS